MENSLLTTRMSSAINRIHALMIQPVLVVDLLAELHCFKQKTPFAETKEVVINGSAKQNDLLLKFFGWETTLQQSTWIDFPRISFCL